MQREPCHWERCIASRLTAFEKEAMEVAMKSVIAEQRLQKQCVERREAADKVQNDHHRIPSYLAREQQEPAPCG